MAKQTEEARRELYEAGMSDKAIGDALGVNKSAIRHWRNLRGLPPNFIAVPTNPDRRRLYDEGLNDSEIARMHGVTKRAIALWREEHGLPRHAGLTHILTPDERARRMLFYQLGWSDPRMAKEEKVRTGTIRKWRNAAGLAANFHQGNNGARRGSETRDVLARIKRAVGRGLPADIADDAVGDLLLAVMDGTLSIVLIEKYARQFGNRVLEQFVQRYKKRSLDEELGDEDGFKMLDLIRDERSSDWLEEMGATVW